MIKNIKKFKQGIQKIAIAICFLPGPILYVIGSHNNSISQTNELVLIIVGFSCMTVCVLAFFWGVRNMLSGFFDEPNEQK